MRRTVTLITFLIVTFCLILSPALPTVAHQLATSGSVGITVHVEPKDSPIANRPAQINVTISNNSWRLEECDCWLYINDADGNNLQATSWLVEDYVNPVDFTFEHPGKYKLVTTGQPWYYLESSELEPFSAEFEVEVLPPPSAFEEYGLPVAGTLALLAAGSWLGVRLLKIIRQNKELRQI